MMSSERGRLSMSATSQVSTIILGIVVAGHACGSVDIVQADELSKASGSGSEKGDCQSTGISSGADDTRLPYQERLNARSPSRTRCGEKSTGSGR